MTACSFLVVVAAGEDPTIHPELIQALGQRSLRGTSKLLGLLTSILYVSPPIGIGFAWTLFSFPHVHLDYDIPFTSVRSLDIFAFSLSWKSCTFSFASFVRTTHNCMRVVCYHHPYLIST